MLELEAHLHDGRVHLALVEFGTSDVIIELDILLLKVVEQQLAGLVLLGFVFLELVLKLLFRLLLLLVKLILLVLGLRALFLEVLG